MDEIWAEIEGFPGYQISNHGRVFSSKSNKILKPGAAGAGYRFVVLYDGKGNPTNFYLHTLVSNAFLPDKPSPKHEPNHIDGDKDNNRVDNFEWLTRGENIAHAYQTGLRRSRKGEPWRLN